MAILRRSRLIAFGRVHNLCPSGGAVGSSGALLPPLVGLPVLVHCRRSVCTLTAPRLYYYRGEEQLPPGAEEDEPPWDDERNAPALPSPPPLLAAKGTVSSSASAASASSTYAEEKRPQLRRRSPKPSFLSEHQRSLDDPQLRWGRRGAAARSRSGSAEGGAMGGGSARPPSQGTSLDFTDAEMEWIAANNYYNYNAADARRRAVGSASPEGRDGAVAGIGTLRSRDTFIGPPPSPAHMTSARSLCKGLLETVKPPLTPAMADRSIFSTAEEDDDDALLLRVSRRRMRDDAAHPQTIIATPSVIKLPASEVGGGARDGSLLSLSRNSRGEEGSPAATPTQATAAAAAGKKMKGYFTAAEDAPPPSMLAMVRHFGHHLWPSHRWDLRARLVVAMACVMGTKVLKVYVPVVFKQVIDSLVVAKEVADASAAAAAVSSSAASAPAAVGLSLTMPAGTTTGPLMAYVASVVSIPALSQSIVALVCAYGLARICTAVLQEAAPVFFSRIGTTAANSVSLDVFRKLHALDLHFHVNKAPGSVAKEMDRSTRAFGDLAKAVLFVLLPTIVELGLACYVLYTHAGLTMAASALGSITAFVAFTVVAARWRSRYPRRFNQQDSRLGKIVVDSLVNYETVKLFNNEAFEFARVKSINNEINTTVEKLDASLSALRLGQHLIVGVTLMGCMLYSTMLLAAGTMTIGNVVLVETLLLQLFAPLTTLGSVYREAYGASINMQASMRLFQLPCDGDTSASSSSSSASSPLPLYLPKDYSIAFHNVSYGYDGVDGPPVLNNVSFAIEGGSTVAFVGPSGCGKSTIIRLMYRFFEPTSGRIEVDGQDIAAVEKDSYRQHIGVVPQDLLMFNDTIRFNIRYGDLNASDEEVEAAAKAAHIHDVIMRMPLGYDTIVGDRGLRLSGGEKQRIAIARVLLKRSHILLADESTSALDSMTESSVMRLLTGGDSSLAASTAAPSTANGAAGNNQASPDDASRDKEKAPAAGATDGASLPPSPTPLPPLDDSNIVTTILIAHRLSTIRDVHCIFVLSDRGTLVEEGTHDALMAKRGQYFKMWGEQHAGAGDSDDPFKYIADE